MLLLSSLYYVMTEPLTLTDLSVWKAGRLTLSISKSTGRFNLLWGDSAAILDSFGEAVLPDGTMVRTDEHREREIRSERSRDVLGRAHKVTVRHLRPDSLELRHTFWIYEKTSEAVVRLDLLDPSGRGSRQIAPISTKAPVLLAAKGPLQSLFVPYDNDKYSRYSSQGWGQDDDDQSGSHGVGAVYDDSSRRGLIVGAIDHDTWKSGVRFVRRGGVRAAAGFVSSSTHDTVAHGTVEGTEVRSARFVVVEHADWREGMERYGEINAKVAPPLKWSGRVPFGWNSWAGHKEKLQASDANAALDFIHKDLPSFRNDKTAYINLDSFWDNFSAEELSEFVRRTHASGLKAGIYYTPFVNWGEPDWKAIDEYHFRDLQLKDAQGEFLPKLSGGWPLDPTHPGTQLRIQRRLQEFIDQGFDYVKLDFTTHGALEGSHFDPKIHTGTQAYRVGMQRIVDQLSEEKIGRPFFISLSIAPLFPHGFGHSRRISCDVFGNIGATEYLLNSQNYSWWTGGRLYQFNDPDHASVYQTQGESVTTEAEARSRMTASVIGGGLLMQGDNLADERARERVLRVFSNQSVLKLASIAPTFRPVFGATGDKGGDLFTFQKSAKEVYLAAFNFSSNEPRMVSTLLSRLNLSGAWKSRSLWDGVSDQVEERLSLTIPPMDCVLLRLDRAD